MCLGEDYVLPLAKFASTSGPSVLAYKDRSILHGKLQQEVGLTRRRLCLLRKPTAIDSVEQFQPFGLRHLHSTGRDKFAGSRSLRIILERAYAPFNPMRCEKREEEASDIHCRTGAERARANFLLHLLPRELTISSENNHASMQEQAKRGNSSACRLVSFPLHFNNSLIDLVGSCARGAMPPHPFEKVIDG